MLAYRRCKHLLRGHQKLLPVPALALTSPSPPRRGGCLLIPSRYVLFLSPDPQYRPCRHRPLLTIQRQPRPCHGPGSRPVVPHAGCPCSDRATKAVPHHRTQRHWHLHDGTMTRIPIPIRIPAETPCPNFDRASRSSGDHDPPFLAPNPVV